MASILSNYGDAFFNSLGISRSYVQNADGSHRRRDREDPDPESEEEMTPPSNRSSGASEAEAGGIQWDTPTRPPQARLPLGDEEIGPAMKRSFTRQSGASKRAEQIYEDLVSLQYVIASCLMKSTKFSEQV